MVEISGGFVVSLGIILYLLYRYLTKTYSYWKDRNVAHDPPRLIFGNIIDLILFRKVRPIFYQELFEKFPDEPFIGLYHLRMPELVLKDHDIIQKVLMTDFQYFQDRRKLVENSAEPLNSALNNYQKDKWRPVRQKLTPVFTTGKLRNMVPLMLEVGEEFTNYLKKVIGPECEIEARELTSKFTTDVIGSVAFGVKMNSMIDIDAPFGKMGKKIFEMTPMKSLKFWIRHFFPHFYSYFKLSLQEKGTLEFFKETLKDVIEERQKSGVARNDFVDLLLALRDKDKELKYENEKMNSIVINDTFILAHSFIFFLAGFDTTSSLMAYILHELSLNQEIEKKVYEEIRTALDKCDGKLTYDVIINMEYLNMVMNEALRKYPPGNLFRMSTSKYTFPGTKVTIDEGTYVTIPVYAHHRNTKYFPDPEKFTPERFTREAKEQRHPMAFIPFGDGPRNCIGSRFAKVKVIVGLVTLLKDYCVEPCNKTENKVQFDEKSMTLKPKNGLWLRIKERH